MKAYITFNRKGLVALITTVILIFLVCCEIYSVSNTDTDAKTNAERINFIEKMGYSLLSSVPESKTVTIPETFSDVYNNYNELQHISGYDLDAYKGCEVIIYTYSINAPKGYSGECVFNMMVYNDRVIGGDVSSCALGGFMLPINNKSEK